MQYPAFWDHLFVALVFVVYPYLSFRQFDAQLARIKAGGEAALVGAYRHVILSWLLIGAAAVVLWIDSGRSWSDLGLGSIDPVSTLIALVCAIAVIAVVVLPLRKMANGSEEGVRQFMQQIGKLVFFMPKTEREERWFSLVSLNAGVTEEVVFRGFLIWYLQHFVSLPWAAVIAVVAFAGAHLYQGVKQMPAILFVSTVAVGLYVYTGSLLVPILFHIVLDAIQGRYIAKILRTHGRDADADQEEDAVSV